MTRSPARRIVVKTDFHRAFLAMTTAQMDEKFNELSNITDQVALMNSPYETDLEAGFAAMEGLVEDSRSWDLDVMSPEARRAYLSHMSFHREIVAEIIVEARRRLIQERRPYLKRLVNYHKSFSTWLLRLEKKYAA